MGSGAFLKSVWGRSIAALVFCLSGAFATFLLLFSASSFWYLPCAVLWALSGVVWFVRPSFAAGLSAFPVLGVAVMLAQALPRIRQVDSFYWSLVLCVVVAIAIIATSFWQREARKLLPLSISFSLVILSFGVDRLFTNNLAIHTHLANWSADGVAPWGRVETNGKGEIPVVVYWMVGGGYCYDAIFSSELKARLRASQRLVVPVEYNVFSDFGHERAYNIRSVDGLLFNDVHGSVRPENGFGGYTQNPAGSVACKR